VRLPELETWPAGESDDHRYQTTHEQTLYKGWREQANPIDTAKDNQGGKRKEERELRPRRRMNNSLEALRDSTSCAGNSEANGHKGYSREDQTGEAGGSTERQADGSGFSLGPLRSAKQPAAFAVIPKVDVARAAIEKVKEDQEQQGADGGVNDGGGE
jgi:hypothetical protein